MRSILSPKLPVVDDGFDLEAACGLGHCMEHKVLLVFPLYLNA